MTLNVGAYRQNITYWAPAAMDGYGNRTFSTPILLKGRWEDRTDLNIGSVQEFQPSKAVVYLKQAVALGGYLALGDYAEIDTPETDPTTLSGAHQIQQYSEIPAIAGTSITRKAVL